MFVRTWQLADELRAVRPVALARPPPVAGRRVRRHAEAHLGLAAVAGLARLGRVVPVVGRKQATLVWTLATNETGNGNNAGRKKRGGRDSLGRAKFPAGKSLPRWRGKFSCLSQAEGGVSFALLDFHRERGITSARSGAP